MKPSSKALHVWPQSDGEKDNVRTPWQTDGFSWIPWSWDAILPWPTFSGPSPNKMNEHYRPSILEMGTGIQWILANCLFVQPFILSVRVYVITYHCEFFITWYSRPIIREARWYLLIQILESRDESAVFWNEFTLGQGLKAWSILMSVWFLQILWVYAAHKSNLSAAQNDHSGHSGLEVYTLEACRKCESHQHKHLCGCYCSCQMLDFFKYEIIKDTKRSILPNPAMLYSMKSWNCRVHFFPTNWWLWHVNPRISKLDTPRI